MGDAQTESISETTSSSGTSETTSSDIGDNQVSQSNSQSQDPAPWMNADGTQDTAKWREYHSGGHNLKYADQHKPGDYGVFKNPGVSQKVFTTVDQQTVDSQGRIIDYKVGNMDATAVTVLIVTDVHGPTPVKSVVHEKGGNNVNPITGEHAYNGYVDARRHGDDRWEEYYDSNKEEDTRTYEQKQTDDALFNSSSKTRMTDRFGRWVGSVDGEGSSEVDVVYEFGDNGSGQYQWQPKVQMNLEWDPVDGSTDQNDFDNYSYSPSYITTEGTDYPNQLSQRSGGDHIYTEVGPDYNLSYGAYGDNSDHKDGWLASGTGYTIAESGVSQRDYNGSVLDTNNPVDGVQLGDLPFKVYTTTVTRGVTGMNAATGHTYEGNNNTLNLQEYTVKDEKDLPLLEAYIRAHPRAEKDLNPNLYEEDYGNSAKGGAQHFWHGLKVAARAGYEYSTPVEDVDYNDNIIVKGISAVERAEMKVIHAVSPATDDATDHFIEIAGTAVGLADVIHVLGRGAMVAAKGSWFKTKKGGFKQAKTPNQVARFKAKGFTKVAPETAAQRVNVEKKVATASSNKKTASDHRASVQWQEPQKATSWPQPKPTASHHYEPLEPVTLRDNYHPNANSGEIAAQKSIASVDHGHGGRRKTVTGEGDAPPSVKSGEPLKGTDKGLDFGKGLFDGPLKKVPSEKRVTFTKAAGDMIDAFKAEMKLVKVPGQSLSREQYGVAVEKSLLAGGLSAEFIAQLKEAGALMKIANSGPGGVRKAVVKAMVSKYFKGKKSLQLLGVTVELDTIVEFFTDGIYEIVDMVDLFSGGGDEDEDDGDEDDDDEDDYYEDEGGGTGETTSSGGTGETTSSGGTGETTSETGYSESTGGIFKTLNSARPYTYQNAPSDIFNNPYDEDEEDFSPIFGDNFCKRFPKHPRCNRIFI